MKQRQIKFRAWHKKEKEWLFDFKELGGFALLGETVLVEGLREIPMMELRHLEITQFTGLKDSKGKEIYEGDIIQEKIIDRTFLIMWNDGEARFSLVFQKGENGYKGQLRHIIDVKFMEVIGNIMENPELLKGGER